MSEALHWRAQTDADHVLFVLLNAKVPNWSVHTLRNTVYVYFDCTLTVNHKLCLRWPCISSSVHYSHLSGCNSGHGDLRPASQASGEDSCGAHWERQHQHWRERSAALSSWWVLPPASSLCLRITPSEMNYCETWIVFSCFFHSTFVLHLSLRNWFDSRLLRLSLRRMCSRKRQTSAPSEPGGHAAYCPHDHWCKCVSAH